MLDPHTRNYGVIGVMTLLLATFRLRRARYVAGTVLALLLAGYLAGAGLEVVKLFIERARPEEVLGAEALLSHGRSWAHIASFPSGHLTVTTAIAVAGIAAVPALRTAFWFYVGAIALTRITFGAHFPLDVLVGAVFGYEVGRFSTGLVHALGLLPNPPADPLGEHAGRIRPWPSPAGADGRRSPDI